MWWTMWHILTRKNVPDAESVPRSVRRRLFFKELINVQFLICWFRKYLYEEKKDAKIILLGEILASFFVRKCEKNEKMERVIYRR